MLLHSVKRHTHVQSTRDVQLYHTGDADLLSLKFSVVEPKEDRQLLLVMESHILKTNLACCLMFPSSLD